MRIGRLGFRSWMVCGASNRIALLSACLDEERDYAVYAPLSWSVTMYKHPVVMK